MPDPDDHIARTLRIIGAHPNVVEGSPAHNDPETGACEVEVALRLGLPNAWAADGHSPNGVRAIETVSVRFPARYPLQAPVVFLRADFDRSLAHVLPAGPASRPRPCLFEGDLTELLQQEGIAAVINQLVQWLERAALDQLIDPAQGWEPVRRDSLADFIVADAGALRELVSRKGGFAAFAFEYAALIDPAGGGMLHGAMRPERVLLNPKTAEALFRRVPPEAGDRWRIGRSIAVVVWPGRAPSGKLIVAGSYQPETVTDIASLRARAADYGCATELDSALRRLQTSVAQWRLAGTPPVAVILAARRPYPVIGTNSPIELCPYIVEVGAPKLLPEGEGTRVRPAGHRQSITPGLLRQLSDDEADNTGRLSWIQMGCGSLGSKIALHLARAGRAPSIVIDRSYFSPHNAARHALLPRPGQMQTSWLGDKAAALAEAIAGLGQHADSVVEDVAVIAHDKEGARKALPKRAWGIVNATASLTVREALGSVPSGIEIPRVIEAVLYAAGWLGVMTVEGPDRNPDSLDLLAETYTLAREQETLRALMFAGGAGLMRQSIGEGCGSATMPLADARVSMLAAPMAQIITRLQRHGLPERGGRIQTAVVGEDGVSVTWSSREIDPAVVVSIQGPPAGWHVHLSARAARKITDEVARWPQVETGGILMGRMSEAARAFYITDILPASEDSERSAGGFCLGTRGARQMISDYAESSGYSLFCLGTWHSYLAPSGPSAVDRATAATIALARPTPSVLLIHTPAGYVALLAHASRSSDSGVAA